jgi:release factor H-coupled RctB family protein
MHMSFSHGASIRIIASLDTWIEGEAVRQLETTAKLPGMRYAVGLPDLHPGRGHPVGAAFISEGIFYPHLVGSDIGCGMGLWHTALERDELRPTKAIKRLAALDEPYEGDVAPWLAAEKLEPGLADHALGTVGFGNHFAEVQAVEEIRDPAAFAALGLDQTELLLLVHSGSRGYGEAVLREHARRHRGDGLVDGSDEAHAYLQKHARGIAWARANRALIAHRFLDAVRGEGGRILDICHNSVTPGLVEGRACWLHRKGAAPADQGAVVIPGSRGSFSYIVLPTGDQAKNAFSLAHGSGRKWAREACEGRLRDKWRPENLKRTPLGGVVICEDKALLYEEAPQAYKPVESVVGDLVEAGLCAVVAILRPLLTFKTAKGARP